MLSHYLAAYGNYQLLALACHQGGDLNLLSPAFAFSPLTPISLVSTARAEQYGFAHLLPAPELPAVPIRAPSFHSASPPLSPVLAQAPVVAAVAAAAGVTLVQSPVPLAAPPPPAATQVPLPSLPTIDQSLTRAPTPAPAPAARPAGATTETLLLPLPPAGASWSRNSKAAVDKPGKTAADNHASLGASIELSTLLMRAIDSQQVSVCASSTCARSLLCLACSVLEVCLLFECSMTVTNQKQPELALCRHWMAKFDSMVLYCAAPVEPACVID